jgi:hypothetical protein
MVAYVPGNRITASSAMKIEAICFAETLVATNETTSFYVRRQPAASYNIVINLKELHLQSPPILHIQDL